MGIDKTTVHSPTDGRLGEGECPCRRDPFGVYRRFQQRYRFPDSTILS